MYIRSGLAIAIAAVALAALVHSAGACPAACYNGGFCANVTDASCTCASGTGWIGPSCASCNATWVLPTCTQIGLPGLPTNLTVTVFVTFATITWDPPIYGDPFLKYYVDVIDNTTQEFITGSELPSPDYRNMTIGPLALDTYYEAAVQSYNSYGWGDYALMQFNTFDQNPLVPSEPMNLDCEFATTESFVVKWTAPLYMPEPLTGYTFYIRRSNETAFQEVEISATDATSYVADGLAIATDYTIALSASDPDGEGPATAYLTCSTVVPAEPAAPVAVDVFSPTESTLTVSWEPPPYGFPIDRYVVYWRPTPTPAAVSFARDDDGVERMEVEEGLIGRISGLASSTSYDVEVAAVNEFGEGPLSFQTTRATSPPFDPPPGRISAGTVVPLIFGAVTVIVAVVVAAFCIRKRLRRVGAGSRAGDEATVPLTKAADDGDEEIFVIDDEVL